MQNEDDEKRILIVTRIIIIAIIIFICYWIIYYSKPFASKIVYDYSPGKSFAHQIAKQVSVEKMDDGTPIYNIRRNALRLPINARNMVRPFDTAKVEVEFIKTKPINEDIWVDTSDDGEDFAVKSGDVIDLKKVKPYGPQYSFKISHNPGIPTEEIEMVYIKSVKVTLEREPITSTEFKDYVSKMIKKIF